ncbi:CRISPR-associated helicase Cas3' [Nocardioides carbamazepini]|uniref:CRISPR-associated helicase Cas3' n=1 Tax=Nocardioides carbamazepini TaxID=2854259 RepID=UPI00214A31D7|nr:CRISPR-associated helicase Cas3' [Nocardioides carbamazepini]MCR1781136.1 CRISPR-associated helicase Cas3' [Nocardioides carbamazepini]
MSTDPGRYSDAAWSVWGKSADFAGTDSMALVQHLEDSADVAALVWDWLPVHIRSLIEASLPPNARDGRRLLQWLAGVHDIGKCSPPFAAKVPALADRMREHGLLLPRDSTEFSTAPHGLVGHHILQRWLREHHGFGLHQARSQAVVVGGHHGTPPTTTQLSRVRSRPDLVGEGRWAEVQDEILDATARRLDLDELLAAWTDCVLPATVQALLTGAVIVSDWLASNTDLFPFGECGGQGERAERAWQDLGLPAPWAPSRPEGDAAALLARRFPALAAFAPRPIQRIALTAARTAGEPPLIIVEATMGSGKTEAALLAAEALAARFGCGGVYVALPTMATSDAMFDRVLGWISRLDQTGALSTHLAHGKAGLNDRYRELVAQRRVSPVYDDGATAQQAEARVLSWLTGRKKGVLATMVVGTIDQLLFTALQAKHLALRHLAFAGKVVIIDEAHAADDYMRAYLTRALEWLAAYGVPVVLMSATLPHGQRQELADAYRRGLGEPSAAVPEDAPYPAVTTVGRTGVEVTGSPEDTPPEPPRSVEVTCLDDELESLAATLERLLAEGGCAAVIRNTVGRAQDAARFLRERLPEVEVVLIHSRFVATHRAQRETRLRNALGPPGARRPARQVVVGTQVLEQSLDLDFDVMASDLAPVDLLLQRVGRLHRHRRGDGEADRPEPLRSARLYVTGVADWGEDGVPEPVRGSRAIYDLSLLLRGAAVLGLTPGTPGVLTLPHDIRPLVEEAYATPVPGPVGWGDVIVQADESHRLIVGDQRRRADDYRLRAVAATSDLRGWLELGGGSEADDTRSPGASRVRDSEDGIEVIVVQRRTDGEIVYLKDGSEYAGRPVVPLHGPPDNDIARALAATTVRLPLQLTNDRQFDATLAALEAQAHVGWQESHWLAGQLALHLDDSWRAELGGYQIGYDLETGLMVTGTGP